MPIARFFLYLLISATTLPANADQPDIVLKGELSRADHQTYRELPFKVPPGTDRITVEFEYDRGDGTTIDLGLLDSERMRGWSGGNKSRFTLSETDATPSYLPGPLPAGEWRLLLGIPNIREGVTTEYTARVFLQRGAGAFTLPFSGRPLRDRAGWYRGELHAHTGHSDGGCRAQSGERHPCPLFHTLGAAADRSLDFIAVSEHNTRSHHGALRELQTYYDQMLLLPSREITTFYGHANIFGSTGFVDFRVTDGDVKGLQKRVGGVGALLSINHPGLPSGEACMGCGWTAETDYDRVAAVEVVNGSVLKRAGGRLDHRFSGIPFWEKLLDRGYRITAIAGSDNHDPMEAAGQPGGIGRPLTAIHARELSQQALMEGLAAGRVFIDLQGEGERSVEIDARSDSAGATMGELLRLEGDGPVQVTVNVRGVADAFVRLIASGNKIQKRCDPGGEECRAQFELPVGGETRWLRAEVLDSKGEPQLLSNPVYLLLM